MSVELRVGGELSWRGRRLPGARLHALFTALVGAFPRACSAAELIDSIWDDAPPVNSKKALQVLVARARSATEAHVIAFVDGGYRLGLDASSVDVLASAELVRAAGRLFDAGNVSEARTRLSEASAIMGEHAGEDAQRLAALIGAHTDPSAGVLAQLERLIRNSPTDEQLAAAYLRALNHVHGPSYALEALEKHRRILIDTTGMSPGPLLREVERDLLGSDEPVRRGLAHEATQLVGRDSDIENLHRLLQQQRIVSIIGTGGLGKTRLAHAIGRTSQRAVINFVDLTAVNASDDLLVELAASLGVQGPAGQSPSRPALRTQIVRYVSRAPSLLILDNCEQIVDQVAEVVAFLIASTTDLRVLTTTRAALNIAGEHRYHLSALDSAAAHELFIDRARAARSEAHMPDSEVAELVDQLERIPLAIELAAAKVRAMAVSEIRARLGDRFALLRGRSRTSPQRHQTMFEVLDWSWNLLTSSEQQALCRFALLPDGLTPDIAHDLASGGEAALEALIDQSLVNVTEASDGVRYRMYETVREFATEKLADNPTHARGAYAARAAWARTYAKKYREALHNEHQIEAMGAIHREETNLSETAHHAIETDDATTALEVLATLVWYWIIAGKFQRVLTYFRLLEDRLSRWNTGDATAEITRIAATGLLIPQALGVRLEGRNLGQALEELGPSRTLGPVRGYGEILLAIDLGDLDLSIKRLQEFGDSDDVNVALPALQALAHMFENNGSPREAAEIVSRSLDLHDPNRRPWPRAMQIVLLAQLHIQLGEFEIAREYAHRVFDVLQQLGAIEEMRVCNAIFTVAALHEKDFDAAESALNSLDAYDKRHGYLDSSVVVLGRAELALARGDIERGLELFETWHRCGVVSDLPGVVENTEFAPWVLFTESATLVALARFGTPPRGTDLFGSLWKKLTKITHQRIEQQDYPALGMVLFAVGTWGLLRDELPPQQAVRLLGLAKAMSYNRISPSMAWELITEPAEAAAPGVLAEVAQQTRGQRGRALLPALRETLEL